MHRVRVPVLEKFRSPLRPPPLPTLSPTPPLLQPASLVERTTIMIFTLHASVGNEQTSPEKAAVVEHMPKLILNPPKTRRRISPRRCGSCPAEPSQTHRHPSEMVWMVG